MEEKSGGPNCPICTDPSLCQSLGWEPPVLRDARYMCNLQTGNSIPISRIPRKEPSVSYSKQQPSYTLGLGDKGGHSLDAEGLKLQGADIVEGHTL